MGLYADRAILELFSAFIVNRVADAKVEADGDIHIALQDANGEGVGLLAPRFQLAQSGVRFGKLCFAGRHRSFPSTITLCGKFIP
jgi:hypothetical protein